MLSKSTRDKWLNRLHSFFEFAASGGGSMLIDKEAAAAERAKWLNYDHIPIERHWELSMLFHESFCVTAGKEP